MSFFQLLFLLRSYSQSFFVRLFRKRISARDALKHSFLHGTVSPTRRFSCGGMTPQLIVPSLTSPDSVQQASEREATPPATPITAKPEYGLLAAPRPKHATPVVRINSFQETPPPLPAPPGPNPRAVVNHSPSFKAGSLSCKTDSSDTGVVTDDA